MLPEMGTKVLGWSVTILARCDGSQDVKTARFVCISMLVYLVMPVMALVGAGEVGVHQQ